MGDFGCSLLSEFVEEHVEGGLGPTRSRPDETAGVVVDHDDQVTVSPFVGDLVDPDPTQTPKTVDTGFDVVVDPGDDRPDGPSRHPQQLTGRTLRGADSEPGRHRVEVAGVASAVSRPRNLSNRLTMGSALDSWSISFDKHTGSASVESTPTSPAVAAVITR